MSECWQHWEYRYSTMRLSIWRILLIVFVILLVALAVIFHLIALVTDYWLKSSTPYESNFLNIGLWRACFVHYRHTHEEGAPEYDGCHDLHSDVYEKIRDWLVPCKITTYFRHLSVGRCDIIKYSIDLTNSHSVFLFSFSYFLFFYFCFLRILFSNISQTIDWEDHVRNDLWCVNIYCKTLNVCVPFISPFSQVDQNRQI